MTSDIKTAIKENNIAEIQFDLKNKLNSILQEKLSLAESPFEDYWRNTLAGFKSMSNEVYTLKNNDVLQQGNVDLFRQMVNDDNQNYQVNTLEYQKSNTLTDKYIDIIHNAKMFGAKDNGQLYDNNSKLIIDFMYPQQVEHFLEWLKRYDPQLETTNEATFDTTVGNIVRVTLFYPYKL